MTRTQGIGASLPRKEDRRHLHGRGQFTADLQIACTQEVAFVRSPIAHGRIVAIEPPPEITSQSPSGDWGQFFTADDFPELKGIRSVPTIPGFKPSLYHPLARDKVRYVGEIIAACIAPTRAEAEDLAQACWVDFEELPAVVDAHEAMRPGAALLHEEWRDNLFVETQVNTGDIESVAARAPVVIEREYRMNRQAGVPLEGRAVHADWDFRQDELVVHSTTQHPHQTRAGIAQFLGISEHRLRVVTPDMGGGFGIKNVLNPEELILCALAERLRIPLRWIEDRREHLQSSVHAREHFYRIKAYAERDGSLLGLDVDITVDAGAYSHWPNGPFMETGMAAKNVPGPYRLEHYRAQTHTVATNKAPIGPYRGVARPGACFAIERTIDELARAVGREPHEVRKLNMVTPDLMPYRTVTDLVFDSGDYPRGVEMAVELIDVEAVRRRQAVPEGDGRLIGVGFASYTEQTAHGCAEWVTRGVHVIPGFESATLRLLSDGSVVLLSGVQSHGQGLETTLAQVVHEELGIDTDLISVRHGDSALSPFGMGTFASRSMVMAGGATAKAARALRDKIAVVAAHLLQCRPADIELHDGLVQGPGGQGQVSFAQIGYAAYLHHEELPEGTEPTLEASAIYEPAISTGFFCYSSQAAVVAVDPRDGSVEILDYVVVEDCGTMVNPMIVQGQILGGIAQGIGTALYEEIPYNEDGQPLATTFADYLMPGATEIPPIRIAHMTTPSEHSEYGIKGMGEGGAIAPPAVIANAVCDALAPLGASINETPITPRRVFEAIRAAREAA